MRRDDPGPRHGRARPRHAPHPRAATAPTSRATSRCRSASGAASSSRAGSASATPWSRCDGRCDDRSGHLARHRRAHGRGSRRAGRVLPRRDRAARDPPRRRHRRARRRRAATLRSSRSSVDPMRRRARRGRPASSTSRSSCPRAPSSARALHRVTGAGHRFTGASDHLVSEALYLDDPEGNGIEIYRDRPREEWSDDDGELKMATLPLDLEGVLASVAAGRRRRRDGRRARGSATCISRSPISARPRRSTSVRSASSRPCAAIPGRCSSRPAATTTTSGSTRGPARARRLRPPARAGCGASRSCCPDERGARRDRARVGRDAGLEVAADDGRRDVVADPSGNRAVLVARLSGSPSTAARACRSYWLAA